MSTDIKNFIAKRVAQELSDGDVVNLGIGLPTLVANHVPEAFDIVFQSENGFLGLGPAPDAEMADKDIVNAGGQPASILPGGMFFDSAASFSIIRGGHVDVTVLGALEVDQTGDFASWMIPGKLVPGMGGAMDLVVGAKRVIIAMTHTAKGAPKILKKCNLPLTATGQVNLIITEMGVIEVTGAGLVLTEIAPGVTMDDVRAATQADLHFAENLKKMAV